MYRALPPTQVDKPRKMPREMSAKGPGFPRPVQTNREAPRKREKERGRRFLLNHTVSMTEGSGTPFAKVPETTFREWKVREIGIHAMGRLALCVE